MNYNINIKVNYSPWNSYKRINQSLIMKILSNIMLEHSNLKISNLELSILLSDDQEIKKLNYNFRKKNKPTNILSFADTEEILYNKKIEVVSLYLGDLALSFNRIKHEALGKNISFEDHFTHLLIHGILHLLGYSHENDHNALEMEDLEIKLLKHFKIDSPY